MRKSHSRSTKERVIRKGITILVCLGIVAIETLVCFTLKGHMKHSSFPMIYFLGIAFIATRYTALETAASAILSFIAYDFFFVQPLYTSIFTDSYEDILAFTVSLIVAILIASLTSQIRSHARLAEERKRQTEALFGFTSELSRTFLRKDALNIAMNDLKTWFNADAGIFLNDGPDRLLHSLKSESGFEENDQVRQLIRNVPPAGSTTVITAPGGSESQVRAIPLVSNRGQLGIFLVLLRDRKSLLPDEQKLLQAFAGAAGLALERAYLAEESLSARLQAQTERTRNILLSSISHDLRSPITVIQGTARLIEEKVTDNGVLKDLSRTILSEAELLNTRIRNILDITKLESGLKLNFGWESLEELIGGALQRMRGKLGSRTVDVDVPADFPYVHGDPVLIDKVFLNIFENISKHTHENSCVSVRTREKADHLIVEVCDDGPGIPAGREEAIFESYYHAGEPLTRGPSGLGLAICRTIMELHGGRIYVKKTDAQGGACFCIEFRKAAPAETCL